MSGKNGDQRRDRENRNGSGNDRGGSDRIAEDDELLSALLDGELDPGAEAELRARMIEDPELARRSAELGELTGQLRNLAHSGERPEAEIQLEDARVERMHSALRVRLAAEEAVEAEEIQATAEAEAPAPVIWLRPARDWLVPAAAALAASLFLYLAFGSRVPADGPSGSADGAGPGPVAENVAPRPGSPAAAESPLPPADLEIEVAEDPSTGFARDIAETTPPDMPSLIVEAPVPVDLVAANDEELAIALEFDVLTDFDVIENLELLELLNELDTMERI